MAISQVLALIAFPIFARYYSPADLGALDLALALSGIFLIFCNLSVDTALTFFYWDEKKQEDKNSYVLSSFAILACSSTFVFFIIIFFEDKFKNYYFKESFSFNYYLFAFFVIGQAFFLFFSKNLRIRKEVWKYNFVLFLNALSFLFFLYYFILHKKHDAFLWAKVISILLACFFAIYFIRESIRGRPRKQYICNLLEYSIPLIPFSIALAVIAVIDRYSINHFMTLNDVGIYSVGVKGGLLISLFTTAFAMAFSPYAMSIKNKVNCKEIYSSIFEIYLIVLLGLVLFILSIDKYILFYLVGDSLQYVDAAGVIHLSALTVAMSSLFSQLGIGLNILSKNKYFFYGTLLSLICNVVFNLLLIPVFGIYGASYSGILSFLIIIFWIYSVSQKFYPLPYKKLLIIFILLDFFIFYCLIRSDYFSENILLKLICFLFYISSCVLAYLFSYKFRRLDLL